MSSVTVVHETTDARTHYCPRHWELVHVAASLSPAARLDAEEWIDCRDETQGECAVCVALPVAS